MKRLMILLLLVFIAGRAVAIPLEWLLVRGGVRDCLAATLEAEERFDELDFLEAVWEGDAAGAEAAARVLINRAHDPEMTRWLARYLRRTGRADEAARLDPPRLRKLRSLALQTANQKVSSHRPVVFLHGYNGDAATWKDMVRMFLSSGYEQGDLLVFDYEADFGADEDTLIELLAEKVESRVRRWLRWRAGLSEDDASHDADLPVPDWICHSMGGLVFRVVLKNAPGLVHRCVTLGTPHFGQAIGEVSIVALMTGNQTEQMAHGSTFLWDLAADWHYRGHRTDDILFIVGAGMTDLYLDFEDELAQDGLVNTFSATMLTQADGAAFAARTFYVNRIHSTALWFLECFDIATSGTSLVSLPGGLDDPVFKLAYGYLNDTDYFANGAVPTQDQVLAADGLDDPKDREEVFRRVREHGALFVQVMDPETNTALRVQRPIEYDPGGWYPDNVIDKLREIGGDKEVYTGDDDGLLRANGSGDEGCENGLVLLYGNIPTGTVSVTVGEPDDYDGPYCFPYFDTAVINAGGTTLWRTRPGAVKPMSAVPVADGSGQIRMLAVSNSWLEAMGLVTSAEDLKGCVTAADASGANGYPVALSALLGLDPSDPDSQVRFDGLNVGEDAVGFSLKAGERPLPIDAPFVLQGKSALTETWSDLPGVKKTLGRWTLPASANRFFRAILSW